MTVRAPEAINYSQSRRILTISFPESDSVELCDKQKIHDVLSAAKNNDCSIRIGVNAGSLEKDILEKYKEPCPEA